MFKLFTLIKDDVLQFEADERFDPDEVETKLYQDYKDLLRKRVIDEKNQMIKKDTIGLMMSSMQKSKFM